MMNEAPNNLVSVAHGDWTNTCGGGGFYLYYYGFGKSDGVHNPFQQNPER